MISIENFKIELIETTTSKWNDKKKKFIDLKVPLVETKTVYKQKHVYDGFELFRHLEYWKDGASGYDKDVKVTFNVSDGE